MDEESMERETGYRKLGRRLLVILLFGLPIIDFVLTVALAERYINNGEFLAGLILGQMAFAFVLAGIVGRTWIVNLLLISLLSIVVMSGLVLWNERDNPSAVLDVIILIAGCTAPVVFCGSLPFLLLRVISGYYLSNAPNEVTNGRSLAMEDFFLTTAVCAAMLVTVPASFSAIKEYREQLFMMMAAAGGILVGVSSSIVMPSMIAYFSLKRPAMRLLVLSCLCIGGPAIVIYVLYSVSGLRLSGTTFLEEFATPLVTAAGCFAMCLVVLRAAGFNWQRNLKPTTIPMDPLRDEETELPLKSERGRIFNRIAAITIVLASIAHVAFCKTLQRQRSEADIRLTAIAREWEPNGGDVSIHRYSAYGMSAPANARLEDIEYVLQSTQLTWLEAAGTKITDDTIRKLKNVSPLQTLDLRRTSITDVSLQHLSSANKLSTIKLANSKVTAKGLQAFLSGRKGSTLDLGNLGLTDADIARLPLSSFSQLTLSHNPLTQAALAHLQKAHNLNLSHTDVVGSALTQLEGVNYINLDYNQLNDEQLIAFKARNPNLSGLSIRGTQVTDACLPYLKGVSQLAVGDSAVTRVGLLNSGIRVLAKLSVNDKQFDGTLFDTGTWTINHLDLRGSSISDQDIGSLARVSALSTLNLQGCDVSDRCLPILASLSLSAIDVSDTKISAEGALQFFANFSVYISRSQCSEQVWEKASRQPKWHIGITIEEP